MVLGKVALFLFLHVRTEPIYPNPKMACSRLKKCSAAAPCFEKWLSKLSFSFERLRMSREVVPIAVIEGVPAKKLGFSCPRRQLHLLVELT